MFTKVSKEVLKKLIINYDKEFNPPISKQVDDFDNFISKILKFSSNIVLYEKKKVIGFVIFYNNMPDIGGFISLIYVSKEYRRMGYATKLINKVEKNLLLRDIHVLKLHVLKDNTNAIKLYSDLGFNIEMDLGYKLEMQKHLRK